MLHTTHVQVRTPLTYVQLYTAYVVRSICSIREQRRQIDGDNWLKAFHKHEVGGREGIDGNH